jgi:hypothetical protein
VMKSPQKFVSYRKSGFPDLLLRLNAMREHRKSLLTGECQERMPQCFTLA